MDRREIDLWPIVHIDDLRPLADEAYTKRANTVPGRGTRTFDSLCRCLTAQRKRDCPPRNDGLGLGLAIVKQVIEAHGGNSKVESKIGEGSTFRFTLPTVEDVDAPHQDAA